MAGAHGLPVAGVATRYGSWMAVWAQWRRWRDKGVWAEAMTRLHRGAQAGRNPQPSLLMLDAQTVRGRRAGPGFHERGGAGGRTGGTKRTVVVDYLGLPLAARSTSARPHDARAGRELLEDVWHPSSKTCSGCGHVKDRLDLAERTYRCGRCGLVLDRDVNAAVNLARWPDHHTSPSLTAAA